MKMLRHRLTVLLLAVIVALLPIIATPASATYVCAVQKSADGFAALRASPSTGGAILARAKEGEAVVIQQKKSNGDQIVSGSWLQVFHFPGDVIPPKGDPAYKKGRVGWMHKRYVSDCG